MSGESGGDRLKNLPCVRASPLVAGSPTPTHPLSDEVPRVSEPSTRRNWVLIHLLGQRALVHGDQRRVIRHITRRMYLLVRTFEHREVQIAIIDRNPNTFRLHHLQLRRHPHHHFLILCSSSKCNPSTFGTSTSTASQRRINARQQQTGTHEHR